MVKLNFYFYHSVMWVTFRRVFIVAIACTLLISCKKRKEGWLIDTLVPMVDSKLDLQNIFEEDLVQVGDGNLLYLVYDNKILDLKLADDFSIPDTTVKQINDGPPINLAWDKTQPLITDTNESRFEIRDANLTEAIIKSGKIKFKINSTITEPTIVKYILSSATKDGKTLEFSTNMAAGSVSNPTEFESEIDLSDYLLNLRGKNQNGYNTIFFYFVVEFANPTSPSGIYNYTSDDVVIIENSFEQIKPFKVKGVFNTSTEKPDETSAQFDAFKQITGGTFEVQKAQFSFEFINKIGVDLQGKVNALKAKNTFEGTSTMLTGDFINQSLNLSRAKEDYSKYTPIIPSITTYDLNEQNSNVTSFISLLPNEVEYDIDFTINPLGNVSGGNDFLFSDHGIEAYLNMRIPLNIKARNLTLVDTVDFDLGNPDEGAELIEGGSVKVHTQNYYPFNATIQIYTLDGASNIIDSIMEPNSIIEAGIPTNSKVVSPTKSVLIAPVSIPSINRLYQAERAIVKLTFNTNGEEYYDLYASYFTKVDVVGDFKYRLIIK